MNGASIFLSVVIPAYNEQPNLSSTLPDIASYLKAKGYRYELIVVDDGSTDNTAESSSSQANLFAHFTLLRNPVNRGKGYSVRKGVLAARGEYILFMDADNSTRIDQLDKLLPAIRNGYDVAIGSRRVAGAEVKVRQPLHRRILGNTYIVLSNLVLGSRVKDHNCGFKLFTSSAAAALFPRLTRHDWSFDSELLFLSSKYGLKVTEAGITWEDKRRTSKVKPLRDSARSFANLLVIRLLALQGAYDRNAPGQ